jgi:hypothetical protein
LVVTKNALFEPENQGNFVPIDLSQVGAVIGQLDPFSGFGSDYHLVNLVAGQPVRFITTTPGGGPFEYTNNANPDINIYDLNFNFVAQLSAGATDGRNVDGTYNPMQSGLHYVNVYSNSDVGEYSLRVICRHCRGR